MEKLHFARTKVTFCSDSYSNVHKRLQYEFGEDYGLRVESRLSEFTTVSVLLPFAPQEDIG